MPDDSSTACSFLPAKASAYASREYWDERFACEEHYEWLESPKTVLPVLLPFLQNRTSPSPSSPPPLLSSSSSHVLIVGCGNSELSESLYACGVRHSVSLDFSFTTLYKKSRKEKETISKYQSSSSSSASSSSSPSPCCCSTSSTRSSHYSDASSACVGNKAASILTSSRGVCTPWDGHTTCNSEGGKCLCMEYMCMDMRRLSHFFRKETFDVVIDKAAMDALVVDEGSVWEPRMEVRQDVEGFLGGVTACLKRGGIFMQITFHQPHFRRRYFLNDFSSSPFSPPPSSLTRKRIRLASQKREEEGDQPRNSSKEKEDEKKKKEEMTSEKGINLVNETKDKEEEELEWILPESFPYREAISSSTPVYWSERYSWEFFSCELKKKTQEEEEGGGGGGCFHNFLFIARKL